MQRVFTRWWRGGRSFDPPMLLVAVAFGAIWLLWPMGHPAGTERPAPPSFLVEALPDGGPELRPELRPDLFVLPARSYSMPRATAELTDWLDVPAAADAEELAGAVVRWTTSHPERNRLVDVSRAAYASLTRHMEPDAGLAASAATDELAAPPRSPQIALVASAALEKAGFAVPPTAFTACPQEAAAWEVTLDVSFVDGVANVFVIDGAEDVAVNHGAVRAMFRASVKRPARGRVTVSWPGHPVAKPSPVPATDA